MAEPRGAGNFCNPDELGLRWRATHGGARRLFSDEGIGASIQIDGEMRV
jgi:hypothetical protein